MTDLVERDELLPGNATPLERAIVAVDGRLDDIDVSIIRGVRDPAAAPEWALPYLAWERSVDVWDPAWPVEIRRAVILAAPEVHRYKGTVRAVKAGLAALQVDAEVVEWWQTAPRGEPYTFAIKAYARTDLYGGDVFLDARLIRSVFATVMRAKPLSRAFALSIGAAFASRLGLVAAATARLRARRVLVPRVFLPLAAELGLAGVVTARLRVRATLSLEPA